MVKAVSEEAGAVRDPQACQAWLSLERLPGVPSDIIILRGSNSDFSP